MKTHIPHTSCFLFILTAHSIFADLITHDQQHHHQERRAISVQPNEAVRALFKTNGEELNYPPIDVAGPKPRSSWMQAYHRAKDAGKIPGIPKTTIVDYQPVYPGSYKGNPCNFYTTKCNATGDIHKAPSGVAGISFDDGPQPPSVGLLKYLQANSLKATHFLIGSRMISNPDVLRQLDQAGEHLACHSYSHPMLTSLTDEEIVGELGWPMQVLHDHTADKRVCKQWRPPYGDLDDRVRAIATQVFGLTTVTWTNEPRDWCLADTTPDGSACGPGNGPQNLNELKAELDSYVRAPKSGGLIILHHEQSTRAIAGFKYIFPILKRLGWTPKTIPGALNQAWYQ